MKKKNLFFESLPRPLQREPGQPAPCAGSQGTAGSCSGRTDGEATSTSLTQNHRPSAPWPPARPQGATSPARAGLCGLSPGSGWARVERGPPTTQPDLRPSLPFSPPSRPSTVATAKERTSTPSNLSESSGCYDLLKLSSGCQSSR